MPNPHTFTGDPEILPKLVDEKVPVSDTMKDDEMMARDGS